MTVELLSVLHEETDRTHRKGTIKLVSTVFNERQSLPEFLEYYRRLGIEDFYFIDNNSDDGTHAYLQEQPDVHLFWTDQDYRVSHAGRLWTKNLCQVYGMGDWCLTVDADEFLVYPYYETVSLPQLTHYFDQRQFQGLFCLLSDHYNGGPLEEAVYEGDTSILDLCPFADKAESYDLATHPDFPYIKLYGGPRTRKFWDRKKGGPAIPKIPLVKWHSGFEYFASTHYCTPIRLADITGALMHFKFLADFTEVARREIERGQRFQNGEQYRKYLSGVEEQEGFTFHDPQVSTTARSTEELLEQRLIAISELYLLYLAQLSGENGNWEAEAEERFSTFAESISYAELMQTWPFLVNMMQTGPEPSAEATSSENMPVLRKTSNAEKRMRVKVDRVLDKASWRATRRLRRWLHSRGRLNRKHLPEDYRQYFTPDEVMQNVYESFWWDLTFPLRIVKAIKKILFKK